MNQLTKLALMTLAFGLLAGILSSFTASPSNAGSGAPVTVMNSSVNPVPTLAQGTTPISGNVTAIQSGAWNVGITGTPNVNSTIVGTPNVNVANLPAVQLSGTPSVTFSNTATTPLFNRDVDSPARLPFRVPLCISPDPTLCFDPQVFTLPLGITYFDFQGGTFAVSNPRFVIEQVTAECLVHPGTVLPELDITSVLTFPEGTLRSITTFPLPITTTLPDGEMFSVFAQMVRLYADPGTDLGLLANHAQSTAPPAPASYVCNATLTGYLKTP